MIKERLALLRSAMKKEGIDAYIIPTSDFHQSEYCGDHFKVREFMSGFTGSAGTLIVFKDMAGLFTDGRYFLQAEEQLKGSTITLYRMGEEGVPTSSELLADKLPEGGVVGFDGRVIDISYGKFLEKKLADKKITFRFEKDLAGDLWTDRPAFSAEPAFLLSMEQTGRSAADKLAAIRAEMKAKGANVHIVTSLADIAWILNIRGNDVACNPVVLSYMAIETSTVKLFANKAVFIDDIMKAFAEINVEVLPYNDIYSYARTLGKGDVLLVDESRVNYSLIRSLSADVRVEYGVNPSALMKACKNETELNNLRKCHIKDGVAVTKFIYWLKKNIGLLPMTEISAANYLEDRRKEQEGYIEPSFDTISGYGPHGAIIHYEPTVETDVPLKAENFLLVDSGGQYLDGTTDITRTIALGPLTDEQKLHYTTVLRANLGLARAKFPYGTCGANLDILARGPFWDQGLDYKHGTGHGVGYILNVHEGPQNFHYNVKRPSGLTPLEEGMITTDEPGIYIEGSHGIRIENELICRKGEKNEFGQFMEFEVETCAPIDLEGVDTELMTRAEIETLNNYHRWVRKTLAPYLTSEENEWLKEYARDI